MKNKLNKENLPKLRKIVLNRMNIEKTSSGIKQEIINMRIYNTIIDRQ